KSGQRRKLSTRDAIGTLLGTVSAYGHDDPEEAREALAAGLASLRADQRSEGPNTGKRNPTEEKQHVSSDLLSPSRPDLSRLDDALAKLTELRPAGKRAVLQAVLATIRHDRRIDINEIELFRAIAAILG